MIWLTTLRDMGRALLLAALPLAASAAPLEAPNVVEISPRLVTSGQPSAAALAELRAQGYGAVVYLAPPTVPNAIADEAGIVERQGVAFLNIPIAFGHPTAQDYDAFAAALDSWADRKVLVHCEVNMRASSMVFLYRTIALKQDPQQAYEAISRVWTPNGRWKQFIVATLKQHGIAFEPY